MRLGQSRPGGRDFAADVRSHVDDLLIPKYFCEEDALQVCGHIYRAHPRAWEIVLLRKIGRDYRAKLEDVAQEAEHLATPMDPESPQHPKLNHFHNLIAEYLLFAGGPS